MNISRGPIFYLRLVPRSSIFSYFFPSSAVSSSERADEFALQGEDGRTTLKNVRLLRKCKVCQALVSNLAEHRHKRILPAPSPAAASASSVIAAVAVASSSSVRTKPKKRTIKHCDVCQKDFGTQREFANHRRRKDFCRPPVSANPPQRRRIGIIRKSL